MDKIVKEKEFYVLRYIAENHGEISQRKISNALNFSVGTVNNVLKKMVSEDVIDSEYFITEKGTKILNNYKVDNAIILAAGMSTRFAPISYEKPKGLINVKGEVLIERQIRQLQEAGVEEIILVVGYLMSEFMYLCEKYNVKIVVNNNYKTKNTSSSVYEARMHLKNTYICCSDNLYPENLFHRYEYKSYYTSYYLDGKWPGERGVTTDKNDRIIAVNKPAENQWIINGFAFFDKKFSEKFIPILEKNNDIPLSDKLYWEEEFYENMDSLEMGIRKVPHEAVKEFDSIAELEEYDPDYIKFNNTSIISNIVKVLKVEPEKIKTIRPLIGGYTNSTFTFECNDSKYVYRVPGKNSNLFIDRKNEQRVLEIVKDIGVDTSYVYEDKKDGWKISHFIEETEKFDFKNINHVKMFCELLHKLYDKPVLCGKKFDYISEAEKFIKKIQILNAELAKSVSRYLEDIRKVDEEIKKDGWQEHLTHNDIYCANLMISKDKLTLIDWEYAGDTDPGYDICRLFVKSECEEEQIDYYLSFYFDRMPTKEEKKHILGCATVCHYYWYLWAVYLVESGKDYNNWISYYYNEFTTRFKQYKKI